MKDNKKTWLWEVRNHPDGRLDGLQPRVNSVLLVQHPPPLLLLLSSLLAQERGGREQETKSRQAGD